MSSADFSFERIRIANERIAAHIVRTPVLTSPMLDRELGCELFVKAESLQKTGSFKFRGALNKILTLSREALSRGVVAYSSGNHGQAVAAAAKVAGASAVIVLPRTAAAVKIESCRWWGAKIVTYDPATEHREIVARQFSEAGMTLISPFDDHDIMAGAGTAGLELCERLIELRKTLDIVVIPSSGGGLSSGVITSVHEFFPRAECHVVEPQGYEKMARSLARGERVGNEQEARTVIDALVGRVVGERTFPVLKQHGARAISVSDEESLAGVFAAFRYLKLVLEPGGAVALAALLARKIDVTGKCVAVVCSGSNIDATVMERALQMPASKQTVGEPGAGAQAPLSGSGAGLIGSASAGRTA